MKAVREVRVKAMAQLGELMMLTSSAASQELAIPRTWESMASENNSSLYQCFNSLA